MKKTLLIGVLFFIIIFTNNVSAEGRTEHFEEGNIDIPEEISNFAINVDAHAERYTTIYYDDNDTVIGKEVQYWGTLNDTSISGEWLVTEIYEGELLKNRSAEWSGEDSDGENIQGEKFEIVYNYNDSDQLLSTTETKYTMNDDWDWEQSSSQTKTYEVEGSSGSTKEVKRIYTVEEAAALVKPTGNTFKIRYR